MSNLGIYIWYLHRRAEDFPVLDDPSIKIFFNASVSLMSFYATKDGDFAVKLVAVTPQSRSG